MKTSDARDLFSDSPDDGWRPLSVQALAEDLRSTHPQITVLRFHAKGGMGAIYEGRLQDEKGCTISVAIKVLRPDAADDADYLRRFRREQDILASLGDHPHIVRHRLHGTTSEGYPFLVMDWVQGRSLVEFTTDRPESKLTRQELLQIADDLCSAVQHAHEHKVLHRDLKPQNIIVTEEGRAVVLDFGIARSLRPGNTFTQPGDSPGTLGYIAPEVQNGEKPDERADIYSLGIILYQLLMKNLPSPFSAKPSEQSFDPRFDEIVMKAANPDRKRRYASAEALREALEIIRQTGKPEPQTMNNNIATTRPDPKSIVIEYDDNWIMINGRVFSSEPFLAELASVFGEDFDIYPNYSTSIPAKGKVVETTYVWPKLGIVASSPFNGRLDMGYVAWPGDESRWQRICYIELAIDPSSVGLRDAKRSLVRFSGELKINELAFKQGWTPEQLMGSKSGVQMKSSLGWVTTPCSERCQIAVTSGTKDNFERQPISRIKLFFERWNQPCKDSGSISLSPDETILNSVSSRYRVLFNRAYVERQLASAELGSKSVSLFERLDRHLIRKNRDSISADGTSERGCFFDLILTTKHLFLRTTEKDGFCRINLADGPAIHFAGETEANNISWRKHRITTAKGSLCELYEGLKYRDYLNHDPMRTFTERLKATVQKYGRPHQLELLANDPNLSGVPAKDSSRQEPSGPTYPAIQTWSLFHTQSSLQEGEIPVFATRKHWTALLPWLIACVPAAFIAFLFGIDPSLIIGFFLVVCVVQYFSNEYVVTDRSVLIRHGILNRSMKDEELLSIKKIGVSMSWLDTFLGRGSVTLSGTGGESECLDRLAAPEGFRDAIQKMQNQRRNTD